MRLFKLKSFARFQRKERIADAALRSAIDRAEAGLIDADLGGDLIKQRLARVGQGKSGGYRTVIALRRGDRAVFLYGFAKNERDNIDADELEAFRLLAKGSLALDDVQMAALIMERDTWEVDDGKTS